MPDDQAMRGCLDIGPIQFEVQTDSVAGVRYDDPAYRGFWHATEDPVQRTNKPLSRMVVKLQRGSRSIPAGEPLYRGGKNWGLWSGSEGRWCICSGFEQQAHARFHCDVNDEVTSALVTLDPDREGAAGEPYVNPLRYPIDQIMSWGLLARCGGVILHGAVAVYNGVGFVFTGRSGAGKSTISEFCHQAGWRILNDDRVILYPREGRFWVAGTPWHGSGRFAEADEVPLGGVYFIQKAESEALDGLMPDTLRMKLLDVAAVPWFLDTWSRGALNAVSFMAEQVPAHTFRLRRHPDAVRFLLDSLAS